MKTAWIGLWWFLTVACVVWYSTVTIYVAIKGVSDVKQMLANLGKQGGDSDETI